MGHGLEEGGGVGRGDGKGGEEGLAEDSLEDLEGHASRSEDRIGGWAAALLLPWSKPRRVQRSSAGRFHSSASWSPWIEGSTAEGRDREGRSDEGGVFSVD